MYLPIIPAILLALTALGATAKAEETEVPFAAGTTSTGWARAVSDATGRVMIESPEFPRGLWVHLAAEAGQALAGIQIEYQGRADSLVAIWSVDSSGLWQETLLWTRPAGDTLRLTLQAAEPADLPPGLASIHWRIDPSAAELLSLKGDPQLTGWQAATALLQEGWQGRTGRLAVQIDSAAALGVDMADGESVARLVDYLRDPARRSLGEGKNPHVEFLLSPFYEFGEESIALITSPVLVQGSKLEQWVMKVLGRVTGPITLARASVLRRLYLKGEQIVDVGPLAVLTGLS